MMKYAFPLQLAREAIFLLRYNDAVDLIKPLSAAGDRDAQFLHSYLHFWDDDLSQSAAIDLMCNAAEQGHSEANYVLAACPDLSPGYVFSLPTTEERLSRLRVAADHGSVHAQTDLARCYLDGIGVAQDVPKARELLEGAYQHQTNERRFSRHALPKTCLLLARMLIDGGGEQSVDEGMSALCRCQHQYGDPLAAEALVQYIELREQRRDPHSEYEIKENQRLRAELDTIRATPSTEWQRYIAHYCMTTLHYDLRAATFDEFIGFVFEHFPHSTRKESNDPNWMWEAKVDFDARAMLRYYTHLFNEPTFLLERYTTDEIERGLGGKGIRGWAHWTLGCILMHADNTVDEAEACIRSLYPLFAKLFARAPLRDVAYMWWDIGYGSCGSHPYPPKREVAEADRGRLSQASFETMAQVLQINSYSCQRAAIHGLGHSSHPGKYRVLSQFLENHPDLSEGDLAYVRSAIEGKIL